MYAISGETWLLSSDAGFVDSDKKCFFLEETSWDHDVSAGLQRFLQHDYAPHFMQVPSGHSAKLLQLPLLCIPALSFLFYNKFLKPWFIHTSPQAAEIVIPNIFHECFPLFCSGQVNRMKICSKSVLG